MDIFYVDGKPILHVVDEATRFQATLWLRTVSAESTWRALHACWIDVYLGPPDIIAHDAGKNFMARAFQSNADMLHMRTMMILVETAHSISIVERYHSPLHRAVKIIRQEAPEIDQDSVLQMAVKCINDPVGPDRIVRTLLVLGALPCLGLPNDPPTPSTFICAVALRKATEVMSRHFSKRQVRDAIYARNGPAVFDIQNAPIGLPVLIYRPEKDKWEGPYSLLELRGEDAIILLPPPSGPTKFRTTVVKPFLTESEPVDEPSDQNSPDAIPLATHPTTSTVPVDSQTEIPTSTDSTNTPHQLSNTSTDHPNTSPPPIMTYSTESPTKDFAAASIAEFNGLVDLGVFTIVYESEAADHRIYNTRFAEQTKNPCTPSAVAKACMVLQAFNDKNHGLLTNASIVQRSSKRILLHASASNQKLCIILRDGTQAYPQATTRLRRPIFARPPPELGLPPYILSLAIARFTDFLNLACTGLSLIMDTSATHLTSNPQFMTLVYCTIPTYL